MNRLEEIEEMWGKDHHIDTSNLTKESAEIPYLHAKYLKLYTREGLRLESMKSDHKQLTLLKTEYYKGQLDDETLEENGWEPQRLKIMKADIPSYLEADKDVINSGLKIAFQKGVVDYLDSIMRQINSRNFYIKNIIDWERFKAGNN